MVFFSGHCCWWFRSDDFFQEVDPNVLHLQRLLLRLKVEQLFVFLTCILNRTRRARWNISFRWRRSHFSVEQRVGECLLDKSCVSHHQRGVIWYLTGLARSPECKWCHCGVASCNVPHCSVRLRLQPFRTKSSAWFPQSASRLLLVLLSMWNHHQVLTKTQQLRSPIFHLCRLGHLGRHTTIVVKESLWSLLRKSGLTSHRETGSRKAVVKVLRPKTTVDDKRLEIP